MIESNKWSIRLDLFDGEGGSDGAAEAQAEPNGKALADGNQGDAGAETKPLPQLDKSREAREDRYQPIMDLLAQRYGVEDGDLDKLREALEADESYINDAAFRAGMTPEQYKHVQKLQWENRELMRREQQRKSEDAYNRQMAAWAEGERQTKEVYPSFDLRTEAQNPEFLSMLRSGVPMRHAYEVIHMEDIKAGVAQLQAKATEKQVANSIRAKGVRPQENGASAQSAFTVKDDVSKLTPAQRADIARRASRGEIITF